MKFFVLILCIGIALANVDYEEPEVFQEDYDDSTFNKELSSSPPSSEMTFSPPTAYIEQDIYELSKYVTFELTCETSGYPEPEITFEKVGEQSLGYNVQQEGNVLRFSNPQLEDRGIYQCIAESNGQIAKASTIIDIYRMRYFLSSIEIYPSEPQEVQLGDYIVLKCQFVNGYPEPILKWTRSDATLLSDRVKEISDGTILISNITAAEAGEYECRTLNFLFVSKNTTTITIKQPTFIITIVPNLLEYSLVEGEKLNLFCTTTELSTIVKWYKLDAMDEIENIDKSPLDSYSTKYIKYNVSQNDAGTYICRASNRYGKAEKQIKVVVESKENTENAETELSTNWCSHSNPCQNNGICESNDNYYTCKCPIHYTGQECDQFTPFIYFSNYKGDSYIEFNSSSVVGAPFQSIISFGMVFRTSEPNGLLIWYGQNIEEPYDGQDFMALAVVDGYLEFTLQLDGQETTIKSENRVDDGKLQQIAIKRNGKEATLQIGWSNISSKAIESLRNFSYLPGNIFIGGAPNIKRFTGYRYKQGFKGCIHIIQSMQDSSLQDIDIHSNVVSGFNVGSCSIFN